MSILKADNLYVEVAFGEGLANPLFLSKPKAVFEAHAMNEVLPAIAQADAAWREGYIVAGFVSYEAGSAFEPVLASVHSQDFPLAWFASFRQPEETRANPEVSDFHVGPWLCDTDRADYDKSIDAIRERIAAGEVYQVNYTYRLQAEFAGDPLAWYRQIARDRHGAYSAFFHLGQYSVLSFSPELFFELANGRIKTMPMKGTAPRGYWPQKDYENYLKLASSEKDQAENLMIVDLMRNDLGKIARVGSVRAEKLFEIHALPTVYQMTSTVISDLDPQYGALEIMKSLFPSGSITGAPKISAMRLIQSLEKSPRGVYCGTIGIMYPGERAVFNVAIRTIAIDQAAGLATLGVGGGITWDSRAGEEYEETRTKSRFVTSPSPRFELLETMRLEEGVFYLLDRHMNRLARSADYFAIPINDKGIRRRLMKTADEHRSGLWRARLTVGNGTFHIECAPLAPASEVPKPVAVCLEPIDTNSPFIFHKTTFRGTYERCRESAPAAFDVLLMNDAGRYTEFTIGNLVVEQNGVRMTPPVSEGLLPGVFRDELLETGQIIEQPITREDLKSADAIWLINSVRKWVSVTLAEERKCD